MKIRTAKIQDIESIIPVFMDYEKASEGYLSKEYKGFVGFLFPGYIDLVCSPVLI